MDQSDGSTPPETTLPDQVVSMNQVIRNKLCRKFGHKYEAVEDSDQRQDVGGDTFVRRSFLCGACGDVINPIIAVWYGWVGTRKPRP